MEDEDRRIVDDLLGQFVARLRQRDLDGAMELFSDDPVLFGSEAGETAHGVAELEAFFRSLFERPQTYGWTWEQPTARKAGSVVGVGSTRLIPGYSRAAVAAVILAAAGLVAGCSSGSPRTAVATTTIAPRATTAPPLSRVTAGPVASSPARPCTGSAPPRHWTHVVWIVMENRGLGQIDGSPDAPYLNALGRQCGLAIDYSAISHPSLPNYIALTSGSTQGISDDTGHPLSVTSLFQLLGPNWRSLEESMPADCDHSSGGEYALKHNPAPFYTPIASECAAQDVPLTNPPDVSAELTFITPNLCDDMHDCSTRAGDTWLSREVPLILNSAQYSDGSTALFITWDENDAGGTVVPCYVIAPSVVPGSRVAGPFSHYSLLRTTEDMLHLTPLLGQAAGAPSLAEAFHL